MTTQQLKLVPPSASHSAAAPSRDLTGLSDTELLATLLGSGEDASQHAHALLAKLSLNQLRRLEALKLGPHCPLPTHHCDTILAALELGVRIAKTKIPGDLLDGPDAVAAYITAKYSVDDQEVMGALFINVRNRLLHDQIFHRGVIAGLTVEPRQVLRTALDLGAKSFVLFHNHPSGDPTPSDVDLTYTRRLADAAKLLGIKLSDHLIVGASGRWVALGRRGCW